MGLDEIKEAIDIKGTDETLDYLDTEFSDMEEEDSSDEIEHDYFYSALSGHVREKFEEFKNARFNSGIETEIVNGHRAFNNQYRPVDLQKIREEGGSEIFLGITNAKCRAAASWIRDILLNPNVDPFMIEPSPLQDLPNELKERIEAEIQSEVDKRKEQQAMAEATAQQQSSGQTEQPVVPQPNKLQKAEESLRELGQLRRDIADAVYEEIRKEGLFQIKVIERLIKDQLVEGDWEKALSDFIDDFVVYPTAIMKGPVITNNKKLTWMNGEVIVSDQFLFENKRVSPLDFYPSPSSTTIQDGDCIEHMRFMRSDLYSMKGSSFYKDEMIDKVLERPTSDWYRLTNVEDDKAEVEKRGTEFEMNKDIIHGMHFFGKVQGQLLIDWGINECDYEEDEDGNSMMEYKIFVDDPLAEYEVEILLAGNEVIKCEINDDPLSRRPYYKASFCNIPGAFWGRSLPNILDDTQRMCNAAARALANNMGLASGPQVELYIDRLADDGDIQEIKPMKIWQLISDKTGGGGRAINFFSVPSLASELLAVYDKFEQKADEVSGIPRYAHGSDQARGAAATAQGLSMLLESAAKSIKDAIRNIDYGLIIPRVEYQFYYNLLQNPDLNYTGDVMVRALGSSALTVKGSQQIRRNEFLQVTANPTDMAVMGVEGRAEILRVMAEDLGLGKNIIPDNLTLKRKQEEQARQAQAAAEAQGNDKEIGLKATQLQVDGQMAMHRETQAFKMAELDHKKQMDEILSRIRVLELQQKGESEAGRIAADQEKVRIKEANENARKKAELSQPKL